MSSGSKVLQRLLKELTERERREAWQPWESILHREEKEWKLAREAARRGPRVLVAPGAGGFHVGALLESSLAVALTLRGAEAEVLLCDSALPGCQMTEIETASPQSLSTAPPQPRC